VLTARSLRRHLDLEVLLRVAAAPAWIAAAAFAAWRLLVGLQIPVAGALAAAFALLAVALRFRRNAWTERDALVLLDRAAGAGGLALSLAETSGPQWHQRMAQQLAAARPPPRELGRPALALAGAAAFVALSLLLPRYQRALTPIQTAAESHVKAAELAAEKVAAEEKLDPALLAELEKLRQQAESGAFDASDWAALDAVNEALEQAASQQASDLAQAEMAARKLAEALDSKAGDEAEQRAREQLDNALAQTGEQRGDEEGEKGAAAQAGQPGKGKPGEGKKGTAGKGKTTKTSAQARELAQALAERRRAMESCSGGRYGQGEDGQGQSSKSGESHDHRESDRADQPGSGAPTRGPGAAPVTFGPLHPIDPDKLLLDQLEKNAEGDPSELEGVRKVSPKPGEPSEGGTLGTPAAGPDGLVPETGPLAPRHRELVKRYFQPSGRDSTPSKNPTPGDQK
jgi:UPF0716 family protein affecting phage T7 exclusion